MKMVIVTTITTTFDVDSMEVTSHNVDIDDQDGLSSVSGELLGAAVIGGLVATKRSLVQKYPRLADRPLVDQPTEESTED